MPFYIRPVQWRILVFFTTNYLLCTQKYYQPFHKRFVFHYAVGWRTVQSKLKIPLHNLTWDLGRHKDLALKFCLCGYLCLSWRRSSTGSLKLSKVPSINWIHQNHVCESWRLRNGVHFPQGAFEDWYQHLNLYNVLLFENSRKSVPWLLFKWSRDYFHRQLSLRDWERQ